MNIIKWGIAIMGVTIISGLVGFVATGFILSINTPVEKAIEVKQETKEEKIFNVPCENCVYIEKGIGSSYKTNPILNVSVYKESELINSYKTVSGRWYTQSLNRNIGGNASPSPNGTYTIMDETIGMHPETGGVFLPYEPKFITGRSNLGFHVDVSWGLNNGEDGTVGCHAFKTLEEYNNFVETIKTNNIKTLIINYE